MYECINKFKDKREIRITSVFVDTTTDPVIRTLPRGPFHWKLLMAKKKNNQELILRNETTYLFSRELPYKCAANFLYSKPCCNQYWSDSAYDRLDIAKVVGC